MNKHFFEKKEIPIETIVETHGSVFLLMNGKGYNTPYIPMGIYHVYFYALNSRFETWIWFKSTKGYDRKLKGLDCRIPMFKKRLFLYTFDRSYWGIEYTPCVDCIHLGKKIKGSCALESPFCLSNMKKK